MSAEITNQLEMKRMKELTEILQNASKAYYQEDAEIMSNFDYDKLFETIFPFL